MSKNILLLETIHPDALTLLEKEPEVRLFKRYDMELGPDSLQQIDAVITRGIGQVNQSLLDKCPRLKIAARCGVGLDNFDTKACTSRGISILNTPGANAQTVAEHTMALMLLLQRNLFTAITESKKGNWAIRNSIATDELFSKTLGIIGMGNIGQKVAHMAAAFGMRVLYWSQSHKNVPFEFVTKDELLSQADIITLHLPAGPGTDAMINEHSLALMKKGAFLINTARRSLVDENALLAALDSGQLAGYAADVPFSPSPEQGHALLSHPKVLLSPHMSSLTSTTYRQMCLLSAHNVLAMLQGKPPTAGCMFNENDLKSINAISQ